MEAVSATKAKEGVGAVPETAKEATAAEKKRFKVVVAVDDSDTSLYALSWAINSVLANRGDDCELVVLHAQHSVGAVIYPVAGHAVYAPTLAADSIRKAQAEESQRILARAVDICKSKQVNAMTAIVEGDPKDSICEAAEKLHADLLVVGSRGLGMIKRAFLGSVSDYLAHHAKCPVLIVKPPKH